jgi:undecaprenyl-diphosphatase
VTPLHAVVLGLVQGATEFLPVSSSGHLILVPALFGWPDQGLAFDAAVHLGTALALLCYFARELQRVGTGIIAGHAVEQRLALAVLVGTIPAGLAGLLLERIVETRLRSPVGVGLATVLWALVLWWADRRAARAAVRDLRDVGVARGLVVGLAEILALIPGTSRSGVTLSAGLFTGLDRSTATRFAFLLGLPVTAAAGLLKTATILGGGTLTGQLVPTLIGVATSFAAGLGAIWFLITYLRRRTLAVFVAYRLALGVFILAFFWP